MSFANTIYLVAAIIGIIIGTIALIRFLIVWIKKSFPGQTKSGIWPDATRTIKRLGARFFKRATGYHNNDD